MKKGHGLTRALPRVARDDLDQMATGALLARLKRLRWCEEDREESDLTDAEIASASDMILFKSENAWKTAYAEVKEALSQREHLDRKP